MKIVRHIILFAAVAALALSCLREDPVPVRVNRKVPVLAVPYLKADWSDEDWTPISRAVSDITAIENSDSLQRHGFGVYAFYTGEEVYSPATDSSAYTKFGLVMNNRRFAYEDDRWKNKGMAEFWPTYAGDNLSLFAYAPWDTWHSIVSYDGKVPSIQYDNYVAQSLTESELSKQRDILWGTNTAGNPHRDVQKDDYDPEGTVDFHFRHATAKISFFVRGILPGISRAFKRSEANGDPDDGDATYTDGSPSYGTVSYTNSNVSEVRRWTETSGIFIQRTTYYIEYECTRTYTRTRTTPRTERLNQTEHAKNYYSYDGKKYLIESVSFKGFNQKGTLLLNNTSAYTPEWTKVVAFSGANPEYVLEPVSGNALTPGMRFDAPATILSDVASYSGIGEELRNMMSGYFLYAIPKTVSSAADRVKLNFKYHVMNPSTTPGYRQTGPGCRYVRVL